MALNRRHLLSAAGASLAGRALAQTTPALPFFIGGQSQALLAKGKGPRVVVCGGGWGGLSVSKQLRQMSPGLDVVMLRFFAGLSVLETAAALQIPVRQVERHWQFARAWLYDTIKT